jgi:hypothetical protein
VLHAIASTRELALDPERIGIADLRRTFDAERDRGEAST